MNYENGPSLPPTPGAYRAPSFPPPPTPVAHQSSYEQTPSYQAAEPFYSVYSSVSKKKNTRASQVRSGHLLTTCLVCDGLGH